MPQKSRRSERKVKGLFIPSTSKWEALNGCDIEGMWMAGTNKIQPAGWRAGCFGSCRSTRSRDPELGDVRRPRLPHGLSTRFLLPGILMILHPFTTFFSGSGSLGQAWWNTSRTKVDKACPTSADSLDVGHGRLKPGSPVASAVSLPCGLRTFPKCTLSPVTTL
ncbi:hypothetical protein EDB89DRAFT_2008758 [Lactarius sanguifluus]|nr:hypothetical protein EDB89DRAFT_2008758 [Lactarius sanguifluus]